MSDNGRLRRFILFVEDDPDDEFLTLKALKESRITNEVVVAHDGVEALDFLFGVGSFAHRDTRAMPDLVLLDLKLPRIDGLGVLRAIRSDERTRMLPVVILTSSREEQDLINGYQLGANSYICKPVDFEKFAAAIAQVGVYWLILNETPQDHRQFT